MVKLNGEYLDVNDMYIEVDEQENEVLTFLIDSQNERFHEITIEAPIEYDEQLFSIKFIDESSEPIEVEAHLEYGELKSNYFEEFTMSGSLVACMNACLNSTSWKFAADERWSESFEIEMGHVTSLEIIDELRKMFDVILHFDTKKKMITPIHLDDYQDKGCYVTDQLNLTKVDAKQDSYELITRLYAYGKKQEDGTFMTFADINDGKPYVDDHSTTKKIIIGTYFNDDCEEPEKLLMEATHSLKQRSLPNESYEAEIIDLARIDSSGYSMLEFSLHDVVTLIDSKRNQRNAYRIVQTKRYPAHPQDNVITLSTRPIDVSELILGNKKDSDDKLDELEKRTETKFTQNDEYIELMAKNIDGDMATLRVEANKISLRVEDVNKNVSEIEQTAYNISLRVYASEKDISSLTITSNSISLRVSNTERGLSTIEQTASQIQTTVTDLSKNVSTITQTAKEIELAVNNTKVKINESTGITVYNGGFRTSNNKFVVDSSGNVIMNGVNVKTSGSSTGITLDSGKVNLGTSSFSIYGSLYYDSSQGITLQSSSNLYLLTSNRLRMNFGTLEINGAVYTKKQITEGTNKYYVWASTY